MKDKIVEQAKEEAPIKVVYRDRGIDFDRLEHMVKMLKSKQSAYSSFIYQKERQVEQECKENLYVHFGLEQDKAEIEKIDLHIERLKKRRERFEKHITKFTKQAGNERYGSYEDVREESKADLWIKECKNNIISDKVVSEIIKECSEKIYLARDIDEAIDIYNACLKEITQLISRAKGCE